MITAALVGAGFAVLCRALTWAVAQNDPGP